MAYDESLATRIRAILSRRKGVSERKMFGGIAFLLDGNMCCGIVDKKLMLRLGPQGAERALKEPNTKAMDFTGRPMKSMIYALPAGIEDDTDLREWVARAVKFARGLPAK
jgi:TfoX/Sxy family transcriptional regulator of competence genes